MNGHSLTLRACKSTFVLRGLVQGQGIRPTIARIAASHDIAGTVRNSFRGVEITAIGEPESLHAFQSALITAFDQASLVAEVAKAFDGPLPHDFQIVASDPGDRLQTNVPLELAVCADCLREVRTPGNRRFGYPLTTCTRCGPRFSILKQMPFDRETTSMAAFPRCALCEAEYRDPSDRRFHAQTIACPDCGPQCSVSDSDGYRVDDTDCVRFVAEQVKQGLIAAVKGVGGYQLICDASDDDAVGRLRQRKRRPGKPLPVMVRDVAAAREIANVSRVESKALRDPANPIVLLRSLADRRISPAVSPHLQTIGVMLPTTPMHALLIDVIDRPLVVTSGNVHGSPLIYQNGVAEEELADIADVFLHHDREIIHPVDDTVVQCVGEQVMTIRAARGITPLTMPTPPSAPSLAVGGHQKVAPAIGTGDALVLTPHIGDMETESCRIRFHQTLDRLQSLYQTQPHQIVCDQHPGYFTSSWANEHEHRPIATGHHHAHVAAAMWEHDLLDQTVLGIAFDGTGYGGHATIWGGEVLLATTVGYQRIGHLRSFALPGGEHAIKHPQRIAQSLLSQLDQGAAMEPAIDYAIQHGPTTSSMGRLFDGVAATVLGIDLVHYEGEAAMRLEACCDVDEPASYHFAMTENSPVQFDWRPVVQAIQSDMSRLAPGRVAMKFHRAVAKLVIDMADRFGDVPCLVTGGVFQNRVLLELVREMARERSLDMRMPGKIPVNDGGLAIGQWVIASARQPQRNGAARCV